MVFPLSVRLCFFVQVQVGRIPTHTRARLCCCDSISSKSVVKLYLNKVCSVWYCWKHLSEVLNSDLLCSIVRLAKKLTSVDEQVSCDQVYLSKVPPFDLFCGFVLVLIFAVVSIRWVMAWYWISSCVCLISLRMLIGYSGLRFLYASSADVLSTWWYTYLHQTLLGVTAACPCQSWWGWWSGTEWHKVITGLIFILFILLPWIFLWSFPTTTLIITNTL
jgi:hypothetical protein